MLVNIKTRRGKSLASYNIYLETGKKRIIAGAVDWPGWCRIGKSEADTLQLMLQNAPRYAAVLQTAAIEFQLPTNLLELTIFERVEGNSTTDFGAPDVPPSLDAQPLDSYTAGRYKLITQAAWQALDKAAQTAAGKELRKGPHGGGRDLEGILNHVVMAENGYLAKIGMKAPVKGETDLLRVMAITRDTVLQAIERAERGELPKQGPRGGSMWTGRFFIRRLVWHALDHAWEIEDRIV